MVTQNPFSLYDFLGYFIPGAIAFYIGVLACFIFFILYAFLVLFNSG